MTILAGVGEKLSNRIGMADYQVANVAKMTLVTTEP